jgi:hypothetical protein
MTVPKVQPKEYHQMSRATRTAQRRAEQDFLGDTQLDRRGLLPSVAELQHVARDKSDPLLPDPRFAGLTQDASVGARNLKQFLGNLDEAAVRETGDKQLVEDFEREHSETVVHLAGHEARVRKVDGQWTAQLDLDGEVKTYKAPTREALMDRLVQLCRVLAAEQTTVPTRELTERETLECVRCAQLGLVQDAITRYLSYSFSGREVDWQELLDNPAYQPVCDRATTLAWVNSRNDYSPTEDRDEYIRQFTAGRPLTITLLDAAWKSCQETERRASGQPEPEPTAEPVLLDDLSDGEVEGQFRAVMRAHARGR